MFDGKYLEWNQKRIKAIITNYGVEFFKGKKVLDLGCGHGDIGGAMFRLGAEVTAVDAREDHLKIASKKHAGLKVLKADLDREWPFINQRFDIIIDLGLLCHLIDYEKHLKEICRHANHLILETAVYDSEDENAVFTFSESKGIYDLSVNGIGSRPSAAAVERVLKANGMDFKRLDNNKLNAGTYKYDWIQTNDKSHSAEKRRFWFAERNQGYANLLQKNFSRPQTITNSNISVQTAPLILSAASLPKNYKNTSVNSIIISKPNKLKAAVCLSGFLRSFEQTFESLFVNLTDQFDCDFFIHTWDTVGTFERHFDFKVASINVKSIETKIRNIYSPKDLVIEPRKQFHINELARYKAFGRDANGLLSMYYKILECNKLKSNYENQNKFKYDIVFRYRPDMLIQSKIIIDPDLNLENLYIPAYGDFGGMNDQFAFSNSKNMDIYCSLFDRINDYLNDGQILNPEYLLKYHIEKSKLNTLRFNCNYILKRPDGSAQNNGLLERRLSFIK